MRWLLLKDVRILLRSPLLVALLVVYPVAVALLLGFALSRGPDKPRIAFLNEIPRQERTFDVGTESVNAGEYLPELLELIDIVDVHSRAEGRRLVREGKVLAAMILPRDTAQRLANGRDQATIEVLYNGEDAVKQRYVESVIAARIAAANVA